MSATAGTKKSHQNDNRSFKDKMPKSNSHARNAIKIDGKWCQMDLTWDDTSDNWYGDLC